MSDRKKTTNAFLIAWADYDSLLGGGVSEAQQEVTKDARLHQAVQGIGSSDQMNSTASRRLIAFQLALAELRAK
ncbi:MAG TPA: hypothetical protein VFF67_10420 [Thermoplasmata archaeon]|nr:hypothetical protein [Thermoplasmata archaeon]